MKTCTSCEKKLPFEMFAVRKATKKDGRAPWCKDCVRAYQRKLRAQKKAALDAEYLQGLRVRIYDTMVKNGANGRLAEELAPTIAQNLLTDDL